MLEIFDISQKPIFDAAIHSFSSPGAIFDDFLYLDIHTQTDLAQTHHHTIYHPHYAPKNIRETQINNFLYLETHVRLVKCS